MCGRKNNYGRGLVVIRLVVNETRKNSSNTFAGSTQDCRIKRNIGDSDDSISKKGAGCLGESLSLNIKRQQKKHVWNKAIIYQ